MDYRSTALASSRARHASASAAQQQQNKHSKSTTAKQSQSQQQQQQQQQHHGLLNYDSDASSTLQSMKNLMAANLRGDFKHGRSREDDVLYAAKHARSHMPPQFREPPSSTGSHGTITNSSIHRDDDDDESTADSASTFSAGPDAESTRASVYYQRGRHRVHKTTGRFGSGPSDHNDRSSKKHDIFGGAVNTSALFRTFKEWQPGDATDYSENYSEDDNDSVHFQQLDHDRSTTDFGLVEKLGRFDKENRSPLHSSPLRPAGKMAGPLAEAAPARRSRGVLQATVQNESDLSAVMSTAFHQQQQQQKAAKRATAAATAATASAAAQRRASAPAAGSSKGGKVMEVVHKFNRKSQSPPAQADQDQGQGQSVYLEELTPPETAPSSYEEVDGAAAPVVAAPAAGPEAEAEAEAELGAAAVAAVAEHSNDAVTNQSFLVSAQSYPLLHNLVTGTLRYTPGAFFYGTGIDAQNKYQLPPGPVPEDEKKIFIDVENIRKEVVRLQEHDEMLQNEILQGERKYQSLLGRFYGVAHKTSDSGFGGSDLDQPLKESRERNQELQSKVVELETALDVVRTQYEEQVQLAADLAAERDAAAVRAASVSDKSKRMSADLENMREKLATSPDRPSRGVVEEPALQQQQQQQQQLQQLQQQLQQMQQQMQQLQQQNQKQRQRIHQLEQMVAEREHVIQALKDEREAAGRSHREACRLYKEKIARLGAEKNMLSGDHASAQDALARKNAALKEQMQTLKQQLKQQSKQHTKQVRQTQERETTFHAVVDRQRTQITKLQTLLKQKEKSVRQLDDNFRRLRESWSAKDETLMRMTEVLGQWPGGLPEEHRALYVDTTQEDEGDEQQEEEEDEEEDEEMEDGDEQDEFSNNNNNNDNNNNNSSMNEEDDFALHQDFAKEISIDEDSMSVRSAEGSMDENMTSAFIIPDLDFAAELPEDSDEPTTDGEDEPTPAPAMAMAPAPTLTNKVANNTTAATKKEAKAKSVAFQTTGTERQATTTLTRKTMMATNHTNHTNHTNDTNNTNMTNRTSRTNTAPVLSSGASSSAAACSATCRHNRVNCVVCCQNNAGPLQRKDHGDGNDDHHRRHHGEKVTVSVPRPMPPLSSQHDQYGHQHYLPPAGMMDPGNALAYVMKLLDDERRHLWMQIQDSRRAGAAEEAQNGTGEKQRWPRKALREPEELWNAYVLKVEQLNRLDDVLEGQRAAGQEMTREEIDVTITRILEV